MSPSSLSPAPCSNRTAVYTENNCRGFHICSFNGEGYDYVRYLECKGDKVYNGHTCKYMDIRQASAASRLMAAWRGPHFGFHFRYRSPPSENLFK